MPRILWIAAALTAAVALTPAPAQASPVDVAPLTQAVKKAQSTSAAVTTSSGAWAAEEVVMVVRPAPEPEPELVPNEEPSGTASQEPAPAEVLDEAPEAEAPAPEEAPAPPHAADASVVDIAMSYVGVPYVSGGASPSGFDCSGFTSYVYAQVGIALPRTSSAQGSAGTQVLADQAQPGDLVWSPGHVAIYVGDGQIIDAPKPGGHVSVRPMWQKNPTFIRL